MVLATVAAATTTIEFKFGTKSLWSVGIREAACGKWPLRDEVAGECRRVFCGKKLNREVTVGTGGQDGQKVN